MNFNIKLPYKNIHIYILILCFCTLSLYIRTHSQTIKTCHWDEGWFKSIIEEGYIFNGDINQQQNVAFYPLYSIACYLIQKTFIISDVNICMLIVSYTASILSILLLHKLINHYSNSKIALLSVFLWLCNPFSFYMFSKYSESIFLLFILAFFYFLLIKQNLFFALLMINLASITRMNGIFLMVVYFFHVFQLKDKKKLIEDVLFMSFGFVAWLSYILFFLNKFNNPFLMFDIYKAWGNNASFISIKSLLKLNNLFVEAIDITVNNTKTVGAFMILFMTLFFINNTNRLPKTILFYCLFILVFFIIVYSPSVISLGRYLLMVFPFYWLVTLKIAENNTENFTEKDLVLILIGICLLSLNIYYNELFIQGQIFVG